MAGANCIQYKSFVATDTGVYFIHGDTQALPSRAKGLVMTVETNGVRIRMDGTASDTGVGNGDLLNVGDIFVLDSWTVPGVNWRSVIQNIHLTANVTGSTGRVSAHLFD